MSTCIAEPSVMSLLIQMRFQGQPLSTGTGFVVDTSKGKALITNRHNVTGRHSQTDLPLSPTGGVPDEIIIMHNSNLGLGNWITKLEKLLDSKGNPLWYEHPKWKADVDFVALLLKDTGDVDFYPYEVTNKGSGIHIGPADSISIVGFPFGVRVGGSLAVWATGFVASEPDIDFEELPLFLVDCRGRPGQSGSAVIAYRSGGMVAMKDGGSAAFSGPVTEFLGIYSGRINKDSDLGYVWKKNAIAELVASI